MKDKKTPDLLVRNPDGSINIAASTENANKALEAFFSAISNTRPKVSIIDLSFLDEGDSFPLERIPPELVRIARDRLKRRGLSLRKRAGRWHVGKLK